VAPTGAVGGGSRCLGSLGCVQPWGAGGGRQASGGPGGPWGEEPWGWPPRGQPRGPGAPVPGGKALGVAGPVWGGLPAVCVSAAGLSGLRLPP